MKESLKVCSRCLLEKPIAAFYRNRSFKDGRSYQCKACDKEAVQATRNRYRQKHISEGIDWNGVSRCSRCRQTKANPEFQVNLLRTTGLNSYCTKCYNKYYGNRPSKSRTRRPATSFYLVVKTYGKWCVYCMELGVEVPATSIDHVVPVARGGTDALNNLRPVCGTCNSSKGAKLLEEWPKHLRPAYRSLTSASSSATT